MARNGVYENIPSGNLLKGIDNAFMDRLQRTVRGDRLALEPFRNNLVDFNKQHAGSYYGAGGPGYEIPLPLISTFLAIHTRSLVPKEPRVNLVTFDEKMRPAVDAMETWENNWFEEIDLGDTLRRCVHDALMTEGRIKVDLMPPEVAESGYGGKAGQPYICTIDEDDWVCDMRARSMKDWTYCGFKYYVPLEVAEEILDKDLHPFDPAHHDETGIPRMFTIGAGFGQKDEIEDFVELWEIHLKRRGLILTIKSVDGLPSSFKKDILRVRKYLGPRSGNILSLGYGTLSGNLRPVSPVMGMMPVHLAANRSYRKLIETADNYKALLPVRGGEGSKDGKSIKNAQHMEIINTDNPEALREMRFNLPPAELQLFVHDLRSAFDYIGGGLSVLGGRGPSADTATQEKIVAGNAQSGVDDMAANTVKFIGSAVRCLNWYLWYHPANVYETYKQIPGTNEYLDRKLYPFNDELPSHKDLLDAQALMRQGAMPAIKVDPYSLAHMTPSQKNSLITQIMAEAAPYAAIMAQQGYYPDFAQWLGLKSKWADEPAIAKLFSFKGNPQQPDQGQEGQDQSGLNKDISVKPAQTTRNYTRTSQSGGQQAQNDMRTKLMSLVGKNGQA